MAAYIVVDIDITDPVSYEEYKKLVPGTISRYGGKYLARGGRTEVLEGTWTPKRMAIVEFESMERAREWLNSTDYAPAKKIRHSASKTNMIVIEGV